MRSFTHYTTSLCRVKLIKEWMYRLFCRLFSIYIYCSLCQYCLFSQLRYIPLSLNVSLAHVLFQTCRDWQLKRDNYWRLWVTLSMLRFPPCRRPHRGHTVNLPLGRSGEKRGPITWRPSSPLGLWLRGSAATVTLLQSFAAETACLTCVFVSSVTNKSTTSLSSTTETPSSMGFINLLPQQWALWRKEAHTSWARKVRFWSIEMD